MARSSSLKRRLSKSGLLAARMPFKRRDLGFCTESAVTARCHGQGPSQGVGEGLRRARLAFRRARSHGGTLQGRPVGRKLQRLRASCSISAWGDQILKPKWKWRWTEEVGLAPRHDGELHIDHMGKKIFNKEK